MAAAEDEGNVRKVYISDSPVLDDHIEYNYVSSDIEDDPEPNNKIKNRQKTPVGPKPSIKDETEPEPVMAVGGGPLTDEDELAREAQYQKELQDRLERVTVEERGAEKPSVDQMVSDLEQQAAGNDMVAQPVSNSETNQSLYIAGVDPPSTPAASVGPKSDDQQYTEPTNDSVSCFSWDKPASAVGNTLVKCHLEQPEEMTKHNEQLQLEEELDDDLLDWKNPPANPFSDQRPSIQSSQNPDAGRYEDMNRKLGIHQESDEERAAPENPPVIRNKNQQVRNILNRNVPTHAPALSSNPYDSKSAVNGVETNQFVPQNHLYQGPPDVYTNTNKQTSIVSDSYEDDYSQPPHYYPPAHNNTLFNPAAAASSDFNGYDDQEYLVDTFHQQMSEIEYAQQLQYQQQHLLAGYPAEMGLQRNMPVMYQPAESNFNEYYVKTPREMQQLHYSPDEYSELNDKPKSDVNNGGSVRALVAPKPTKPSRDFIERNKHRAVGQHSAKPGYSDKLIQRRIEEEQMKEWAPGMIIPRKKAASADDIARSTEREELESSEGIWAKRSRELAHAKQAKLAGAKGRKGGASRGTRLPRYPSDNSLTKQSKIPPINQTNSVSQGYLNNFKLSQQLAQDQAGYNGYIPGQPSQTHPTALTNQHQSLHQTSPPIIYQQQIPSYAQLHSQQLLQAQPVPEPRAHPYLSPSLSPQYGVYYASPNHASPVSGPPSGGYHHQPRFIDINQSSGGYQQLPPQILPPYLSAVTQYPQQVSPVFQQSQQPPLPKHRSQAKQAPAPPVHTTTDSQYNNYRIPNQPEPRHPVYDYSGYLNNDARYQREPANESEPVKPYDGSSYSSSNKSDSNKKLNPYSAIPPIHHKDQPTKSVKKPVQKASQPAAVVDMGGSYMDAYYKEKEKAEKQDKAPTYKVYTMKDYKNLKLEYNLGGLGPSQDPELLREKNEIRTKQLQYGKEVMDAEKKKPHKSPRRKSIDEEEEVKQISGRQLAIEYAKQIPKPKDTHHQNAAFQSGTQSSLSYQSHSIKPTAGKIKALQPISDSSQEHYYGGLNDSPSRVNDDTWNQQPTITPLSKIQLQDLEDLQRRHEEERLAVSEIQYKMQQTA